MKILKNLQYDLHLVAKLLMLLVHKFRTRMIDICRDYATIHHDYCISSHMKSSVYTTLVKGNLATKIGDICMSLVDVRSRMQYHQSGDRDIMIQNCSWLASPSGWWFGTFFLIFHILGIIIPIDWLSYFSEGYIGQPPTSHSSTPLMGDTTYFRGLTSSPPRRSPSSFDGLSFGC